MISSSQPVTSPDRRAIFVLPELHGGRGNTHRGSRCADAADGLDHVEGIYHDALYATFAHKAQVGCTTFALAPPDLSAHQAIMNSTADLLASLKMRGVTHEQIASVLGITTPNATKLYNPATKTGKPRKLSYDEAVKLIAAFELETDPPVMVPLSEPVARLVVLYIAERVAEGRQLDEKLIAELAGDIEAFSRFASDPLVRESVERTQGFFQGIAHAAPRRARR